MTTLLESAASTTENTALTGAELLAKVKTMGNASKSDLARACGYVSTKKDGSERLNFTAFYEAMLQAKGVGIGDVAPAAAAGGKRGRKLSFNTKVQFNGNLLIGSAYTQMLKLQPGDEFEIKLSRRQITLVPRLPGNSEPAGEADAIADAAA